MLTEQRDLAADRFRNRRPGEELCILGFIHDAQLDCLDYLISKTGCSLNPFLRRGIGECFALPCSVPHEADTDRVADDFHPGGHTQRLSSHSSYLRRL